MAAAEMLFLLGIGVVYAIAFATVRNLLVIWPLLTPVGGFFSTVSAGDISMPWIAILGFGEVLGLMALVVWLGFGHQRKHRHQRGLATTEPPATPVGR